MDINQAADYLINKLTASGDKINNLKLHKLLFYIQAWSLAINDEPMFQEEFQAWIHGPVSRTIYDRFKERKMLYSGLSEDDIETDLSGLDMGDPEVQFIEKVLEVYGKYTGTQLEILTHREKPWREAREGYGPHERCERAINEKTMKEYYRSRLDS